MPFEAKIFQRAQSDLTRYLCDIHGVAAVEFAVIVPIMLVLFFGVVEVTNGIAAYRDVTIMAHTVSDLTSQSASVQDSDLTNFFGASTEIMYPYSTSTSDPNLKQYVEEIWINSSLQGRIQWAKTSDGSPAATPGTIVSIPPSLQVANTYVIFSGVSYLYIPVGGIGYVINRSGVLLTDSAYTRPRVAQCVLYDPPTPPPTTCPQT